MALALNVEVRDDVERATGLGLPVKVLVGVADGETSPKVGEDDADAVYVVLTLTLTVGVVLSEKTDDAETDGDDEGETLVETESKMLPVSDGERETEALCDGLADKDPLLEFVGDSEGVPDVVAVSDGENETEGLSDALGEPVGDSEGEADVVAVSVGDSEADGLSDALG